MLRKSPWTRSGYYIDAEFHCGSNPHVFRVDRVTLSVVIVVFWLTSLRFSQVKPLGFVKGNPLILQRKPFGFTKETLWFCKESSDILRSGISFLVRIITHDLFFEALAHPNHSKDVTNRSAVKFCIDIAPAARSWGLAQPKKVGSEMWWDAFTIILIVRRPDL